MQQPKHGHTLLEFLIATLIASIIFIAITHLYSNARKTFNTQQSIAQLHESGQFALTFLSQHIRRSGYLGNYLKFKPVAGSEAAKQKNIFCKDGNWARRIDHPIESLNQNQTPYPCLTSSRTKYTYSSGDILTVRYGRHQKNTSTQDNILYFRSTLTQARLFKGAKGEININKLKDSYPALVLNSHTFYLSNARSQQCRNYSTPVLINLFRTVSGKLRRQPIVSGIEQMQFQFGIANQFQSKPLNYRNANQIKDWNQVVSVKLWLLIRAECPEKGYRNRRLYQLGDIGYPVDDHFRRALFSTIVFLPNRHTLVKYGY